MTYHNQHNKINPQRRTRPRVRRSSYQSGSGGNRSGNKILESVGPAGRIRGNASHIYERYQHHVREKPSNSDRIRNEMFLQYAEHYYRLMEIEQQEQNKKIKDNSLKEQEGSAPTETFSSEKPQREKANGEKFRGEIFPEEEPLNAQEAPYEQKPPYEQKSQYPHNTITQEQKDMENSEQPSFLNTPTKNPPH